MRHRRWMTTGLMALLGMTMSRASGQDRPTFPLGEPLAELRLLQGPWEPGTIYRESVLFVRGKDGEPAAKLLYDVETILEVRRADRSKTYEKMRDYQIAPDGSGLKLVPSSRIPFLNESDRFKPKGSPMSIGHQAGHPETSVLFDNGHYFHDLQIEISYIPRNPKWNAYRPTFAADRLRSAIEKLKSKKPVAIALSGDSISEGYNASAYTKAPPLMPPYPSLIAAQLSETYRTKVVMHNHAVAGWSSGQGVSDLDRILKHKPDLVIIAYGMNDVGRRNPDAFKTNIATMLTRIRQADPTTEVILVSTMTGNSDWMATPADMFPKYRDVLASLEGPGVVLADVTSIWLRLLERKRHIDVTGNGVNHPNDYGHRLYAQAILSLLIDPKAAAGEAR